MKFINFLKALLTNLKFRINLCQLVNGQWGKIRYIKSIKRYIVFCPHCGEYIDKHGICSNPFCPEEICELDDNLDEEYYDGM